MGHPDMQARIRARRGRHIGTIVLGALLGGWTSAFALNPSLDVSQYGHTAWTVQDGYSLGNIFAMAQTPDGYLWFGTEYGLVRFDGVRFIPWQLPAGQHLPFNGVYSLLVARDGTLWIGTFQGLASWNGVRLTRYPELDQRFVTSMFEDREGTIWAGVLGGSLGTPTGRLCSIRKGITHCYAEGGAFGSWVWGLSEDGSGALWAGAETGLWRWKPGPPQHYPMPQMRISDLSQTGSGRLLIAVNGAALEQFDGSRIQPWPIRTRAESGTVLAARDVDSNKLLRDRDGGLWIGTVQHGLVHVHDDGRADVFTKTDGLSGNVVMALFEDREGDIWVATTEGIDRFRELPITTISTAQGLSSDVVNAVVPGADGSIWMGTPDGLTRWKDGHPTIYRKANGLPDNSIQSLYEDDRGRIWGTFAHHGLAYLQDGRFIAVPGVPSEEVYSIAGDNAGNLWLSGNRGLSHVRNGRLVETFPWPALARHEQAKVVLFDPARGGIWLSFWTNGGVDFFSGGRLRAAHTSADGLGKGGVSGLLLDSDGALWASTQEGGLSRIQDGRIETLTARNGLPCNIIHWSAEDNDHSLWLYTGCGLVRILRSQLNAWIAEPARRIDVTLWRAEDGIMLHSTAPSYFGPPFAKAADGKLWFFTGDGIQVLDPRRLAFNKLPPPVHIQQIIADRTTYDADSGLRLPPLVHDLEIDYAALSLVAPGKDLFRYKLEGVDRAWKDVGNRRQAFYTNLSPGRYRFRVIACNNSGVWNDVGDTLQFSVAPAYYQTSWFRALYVILLLAALWAVYWWRLRYLRHQFALTLDARVAERTRIARELHDTLLQSFHGLLLQFQTVSHLLPIRPMDAKEKLDSAIEKAAVAITEGRDAVQGLRTSTVESNDLVLSLNTLGEELAADPANDTSPAFRLTVEGESRGLHPILRDEVYKVAAEALRNAFRHAQASHVEVEIRYDDQQFRLRIRDDGKGMDQAVPGGRAPEGHFGLHGMRERAELAGGKLVIWSTPGLGTELEFRIPAKTAYRATHRRSRLSQMLTGK